MTYCLGLLLKQGLVMIADTRTNAGVDQISTYRKLHVFETPGERIVLIATAGNLSVTQTALSLLREGLFNPDTGQVETLAQQTSMFRVAQLVGRAVRQVRGDIGNALENAGVASDVTLLVGGQIRGGAMALYMVYGVGNFIACGPETPYLQIGETKYGRPMLDRAVTFDHEIYDALKIGLLSFDATIRSNLAVGLPLDLMVVREGAISAETCRRIEPDDAYFKDLGMRWAAGLRSAYLSIPAPPFRPG